MLSWTKTTLALSLALPFCVMANPEGANVVSGQAHIEHPDSKTRRIVTSDKAIIDWHDFSVEPGEKTTFVQPSKSSAVLNRVKGKNVSQINGALDANGRVYLVNPNGIIITKQGTISAASFIGSTRAISNEDFLSDTALVFKGETKGKVINLGSVKATEGDIVLIGHSIDNQGSLNAPKGEVLIGAGREIVVTPIGDDRMKIRLAEPTEDLEGTGIDHSGTIEALHVQLQADGNLYALAINQTGIVQATGAIEKDGKVFLVAPKGKVQIAGEIAAKNANATGGEVRVLGENLSLLETAAIDTSGIHGGGTILVGGDLRGENPAILNSENTLVAKGARLDASAKEKGDGGKVIIWGNQLTQFEGSILVEGGSLFGDGGFAEVSGGVLDYRGYASALAPKGKIGSLLLDPFDLSIVSSGYPANISNPSGGNPCSPTSATDCYRSNGTGSQITTAQVSLALTTACVCIATTTASGGAQPGNITIPSTANLAYNSSNTLTLTTTDTTAGQISIAGAINNSGTGNVVLSSASDINIDGNVITQGDISITSSGSIFTSQVGPANLTSNTLTMIASNNITLDGPVTTTITVGVNTPSSGSATFVVDEASGTAIGSGAFTVGSSTTITASAPAPNGSIFVYTAAIANNTVDPAATFNGTSYTTPTAPFVNSDTAQFSTAYDTATKPFVPSASTPYTFFYKQAGSNPAPPTPSPTPTPAQAAAATTVLLTTAGGSSSSSNAITTGVPTQISQFQPLTQPSLAVVASTYSSGFYIGPLQRPAVTTTACP